MDFAIKDENKNYNDDAKIDEIVGIVEEDDDFIELVQ